MSRKIPGGFIIEVEPPQQCDLCGRIAELRPYGPNGEVVCHPCAMLDKEAARCAFLKRLDS